MIAYIRGNLIEQSEHSVIIETAQGIGYEVMMPQSSYEELPSLGEEVCLHTYLQVKEDGIALFGFLDKTDLVLFKLLLLVNGVGPKAALGILSAVPADDLRFAILAEDADRIAKAPGIGKKTASKVILELKDKVHLEDAFEQKLKKQAAKSGAKEKKDEIREEAVQALMALGYSQTEALKAVRQVSREEGMTVEEVLKYALKYIGL